MSLRPQEINRAKLPFLFKREFELCKVAANETIVLVTDLKVRPEFIEAAFAAAEALGAKIYEMKMNRPYSTTHIGGEQIFEPTGTMQAIEQADLCIVFHIPLGSDMLARGRKAGTRFLMIYDHPDDIERLMSPAGLKEACLYTQDRIQNSREMRVISDAGTDFRCELGKMVTTCQYGYAEEAGRVDHWGGGHVSTWPNIGTAEGRLVVRPGDCWILPYVRYVEDEVVMTVKKGVITEATGKTDAMLIRQFCDAHKQSPEDDEPYQVSHLGWGLNPQARWYSLAMNGDAPERQRASARVFAGNFLFSTGPNSQGGGKRTTRGHYDVPMRDCTVMLDNEVIIDKGKITDPKMMVARIATA